MQKFVGRNVVLNFHLLLLGVFLSSCTYTTPEALNPSPGLENPRTMSIVQNGTLSIRKVFFGIDISQATNEVTIADKRWLCGWASVSQAGRWKNALGLTATPYDSRHCNMKFMISHDGTNLEAREIDQDYPNDTKLWPLIFTLPITAHYFYERDVDSKGRELNVYKKVMDRKNWELSPIMDINLKGIRFYSNKSPGPDSFADAVAQAAGGNMLTDVYEIEVEVKPDANFLAFNGTLLSSWFGSLNQHEMRFNFLEFKGTPGFVKTRYNQQSTTQYMNILHILGNKPNGFNEVNYAAHWDLQKPIEVCLNSFPEDYRNYRQIGVDVLEEMNKAMVNIKAVAPGQKAFVVSPRKMKYDYDLRCPSITWVDDPALSMRAPLGIGLANADITTGEILWAGTIVWGGLIDYIVNRDSESVADAIIRNTESLFQGLDSVKHNPYYFDIKGQLNLAAWSPGFKSIQSHPSFAQLSDRSFFDNHINGAIQELQQRLAPPSRDRQDSEEDISARETELREAVDAFVASIVEVQASKDFVTFRDAYPGYVNTDLLEEFKTEILTEEDHIAKILNASRFGVDPVFSDGETEQRNFANTGIMGPQDNQRLADEFNSKMGIAYDMENRLENHYFAMQEATAGLNSIEKQEAAKSMIKNVMLHEWGHCVGLGHQFEGNRLPVRGTVPDSVYNYLAEEAKLMQNYSSIMDYQSGHTEVALPYDKVKMQAQDELTLTYLYKQQFATYIPGDEKFTFFEIYKDGTIPGKRTGDDGREYTTTYLPQCSDMDAWVGTSPYCQRWDRGYDAFTNVNEGFKEYTESFVSRMNSFTTATGGNSNWANYLLWVQTYSLMNKNRTFYDELRYQIATNEVYLDVFNRLKKDEKALLRFSRACVDPQEAPQGWDLDFARLTLEVTPGVARTTSRRGIQAASDAASLLQTYKNVVGSREILELDEQGFRDLENTLYEKGVAFTEVQKLCRATRKSLDVAKVLLSLKGPDHALMNYDDAILPTGLRGGNATYDYSRIFGRYDQLGLLYLKIAALDVFTNTSSTMEYGWWRIGKPRFSDPNTGKTGYYALYPEEFTDVMGTAIKTNMGFGGTILQDSATMSIANLYLSYFLRRTFQLSNDGQIRGFDSDYIEDLKGQTSFNVDIVAILLKAVPKNGEAQNKMFTFSPKLYNLAKRELIDLSDAYILRNRKVIIRGNENQLIMPLTKLRFLSQDSSYIWALEVTYDKTSYDDPLEGFTIKNAISSLTNQELEKCIGGVTGLASYFNASNPDFQGFQIDPNINVDGDAQINFEKSVDAAFDFYQTREGLIPAQNGCDASTKGIGLISSTALSLNGWILPQVYEYINK